ncbi:MAG: cell division protein ZapA [Bacillota bacterium]|nr:cell division protein ZapA [Bacillota bacterium]
MHHRSTGSRPQDGYNRVRVKIAGDIYDLRSDAKVSHIQQVAALVDRQMTELVKAFPTVSRHRLAILVALNLADELLRARPDLAPSLEGAGKEEERDKLFRSQSEWAR